jgi:hypothetical protein
MGSKSFSLKSCAKKIGNWRRVSFVSITSTGHLERMKVGERKLQQRYAEKSPSPNRVLQLRSGVMGSRHGHSCTLMTA